mmetsp:Transcript_10124/g.19120  ORF Transcript_10124/g.19120 Transcript_10124/m.19120 type:complete len:219 (-) Transcript_10124:12-668(-)
MQFLCLVLSFGWPLSWDGNAGARMGLRCLDALPDSAMLELSMLELSEPVNGAALATDSRQFHIAVVLIAPTKIPNTAAKATSLRFDTRSALPRRSSFSAASLFPTLSSVTSTCKLSPGTIPGTFSEPQFFSRLPPSYPSSSGSCSSLLLLAWTGPDNVGMPSGPLLVCNRRGDKLPSQRLMPAVQRFAVLQGVAVPEADVGPHLGLDCPPSQQAKCTT